MPRKGATHSPENELMCKPVKRGSVYYLRRRIPQDLLEHYKSSKPSGVVQESLNTSDYEEAKRLCRQRWVVLDQAFERARRLYRPLTPAELDKMEPADQFHYQMLNSPAPSSSQDAEALTPEQQLARQKAQEWQERLQFEAAQEQAQHDFEDECLEEEIERELDWEDRRAQARQRVLARRQRDGQGVGATSAAGNQSSGPEPRTRQTANGAVVSPALPDTPLLSVVVHAFLSKQDQAAPMFKKYRPVLTVFLEVLGDRAVSTIRQADIDEFFSLLCCLPPRWGDERRKRDLTVRELADLEWPTVISPNTFTDGYVGAVRPFLSEAKRLYGDQGFPRHLTTEGIKYSGDVEEGRNKQRAITPVELKRLFEGQEMCAFAHDREQVHCYWLPLLGLYTGARVNEVCQLNPQCDIKEDGGIWFMEFSGQTDGDERIVKRVKNAVSRRKVPIHPVLLELGLGYKPFCNMPARFSSLVK